ncbi:MAG: transposase [Betaproteobacteria bacterium]|nr:transposase [Betaproteobacteria bacterium]
MNPTAFGAIVWFRHVVPLGTQNDITDGVGLKFGDYLGLHIGLCLQTGIGSFRDECLNVHWFETMEDAKAIIEAWRRDYNETRPHMALNDIAPEEYARQSGACNAEN